MFPPGLAPLLLLKYQNADLSPVDPMLDRLRLVALVLLPMSLRAQTQRDSVVTATASRSTRIAADRATFYVLVEGTAETAPDAVARVETKLKAVSTALAGFGNRVEAERPIAYAVGATPAPNGYPVPAVPASNVARSVIRVHLNRVDQAANVVAAALAAGATNASSVSFESSVADSVRRARIGEALAVARSDAETLAAALNGRLGEFLDVSTNGQQVFPQQPTLSFDNRFSQPPLAPEVTVTANVTVRYRLVR
jgi:uncharacterized protein YggE